MPAPCPIDGKPPAIAVFHGPEPARTAWPDARHSPCRLSLPSWRFPYSSLLDDLGRVRRVKATPAGAGRFASLDTAARHRSDWALRLVSALLGNCSLAEPHHVEDPDGQGILVHVEAQ
jgi:hypothetical protein